jgi:hypothetical protein
MTVYSQYREMNKQRDRTEYFDHFLFKNSPNTDARDRTIGKKRYPEYVFRITDIKYTAYKVSTPIKSQIVNGFFGVILFF